MIDELGGNTHDLRALEPSDPAEKRRLKHPLVDTEASIRKAGLLFGAIGTILALVGIVGMLLCLVISRASMDDHVNMVLGLCAFTLFAVAGVMFIGLFFSERLHRYSRSMLRQLMVRDQERAEQNDRMVAAMTAAGTRLGALERVIADSPDYGQGVLDGIQMRAGALDSGH